MTLRQYRTHFIESLEPLYGRDESESFFYLTLEKFHVMTRVGLALSDLDLEPEPHAKWENVVSLLRNQVPIQYILGEAHFCGHIFKVTPAVLIPRPETEELVEWISSDLPNDFEGSILDIGTGSGCIPISLSARFPQAKVAAIDISKDALEVARHNSKMINAKVEFIETDILSTDVLDQFDIIVSNPPYVRELEKHEIKPNVLDNEPHLALFVADDDALIFYRKIARLAQASLSDKGKLYFEINQYLAKETVAMLLGEGFESELRKDIYGNDRMIKVIRTEALR